MTSIVPHGPGIVRGIAGSVGESIEVARAISHPNQTWKTELALARLHAAAGRRDAAAESLAAARRTIEGLRGGVRDARLLAGPTDPLAG